MFVLLSVEGLAQQNRYPYVVVVKQDADTLVTDSAFMRNARGIQFPVSKWVVPDTSSFCRDMLQEVIPTYSPALYSLERVILRGAASPEGPYDFNVKLGRARLKYIQDFLEKKAKLKIDPSKVDAADISEEYYGLAYLMQSAGDSCYEEVRDMIEKYLPNDRAGLKRELQRAHGGKLWKRLLRDYFPQLRTAKMMLFFRERPASPLFFPTATPTPRPLPELTLEPQVPVALEPLEFQDVAPMPEEREPRRELLSVKTNLLFDFAYVPGYDRFCPIPNVALEYYPKRGHFTYGASIDFPWWQNYWAHKYFQVRNYQLEARYYFRSGSVDKVGYGNGPAYRGFFLKGYGHMGLFCLCFDENRGWTGEGFGGGLGAGYVLPLGKKSRWRLEFGIQAGYFWAQYDPFQYECPVDPTEQDHLYYYKWTGKAGDFSPRRYRWNWIGPTRVDITLSYDLLFRKRHSKGVSFRSKEKKGGSR